MPYISGTVRDDSGAPVVRTIRFYRRDTGALLGSTDSSGAAVQGDQHFDKVSMLLHCNGAHGTEVFTDSSITPKTLSAVGGARIVASGTMFGGACLDLTGGGKSLIVAGNPEAVRLHASDFTLESHIELDPAGSTSRQTILGKAGSGDQSYYFSVLPGASGLEFAYSVNGGGAGTAYVSGSFSFEAYRRYHVAASRTETMLHLFVDGIQVGSGAVPTSWYDSSNSLRIGQINVGGYEYWFNGRMDDIRVTKGIGRYTANFTPPTTAFPDTDITVPARALGEYHFPTDYTGEVTVVCLDDSVGALENDLILRAYAV